MSGNSPLFVCTHFCGAKNSFSFVGVKFPNQASSITFISKGLTAGLLSISDISEEKPDAEATEGETACVQDEVTDFFSELSDSTAVSSNRIRLVSWK